MIHCFQENARSGAEFFSRTVEPLLRLHRPDLLWIDPALSYIGGESNSQKDVGQFLRGWLNPLLHRYECAAIVAHHSNKPPSGKEKVEWSGTDLAYLGSGSAEWANWARAVIAIRGLGENGVFELCLGKRGGRVGWKDEEGGKVYTRLIGHAKEPGRIHWREADEDERPTGKKAGAPKRHSPETLLALLGLSTLSNAEWRKLAGEEQGMSRTVFFECKAELERKGQIERTSQGDWRRKLNGSPENPENPESIFSDHSPESPPPKGGGRTFRTHQAAGVKVIANSGRAVK